MVTHLVSVITCKLKIRDPFVTLSFSDILVFPKWVADFKTSPPPFFEKSVTDFVENLMYVLDSLPRKCMFTPNRNQLQRVQDLLKLLVCELQKETLFDDCSLLFPMPFLVFPLTSPDPWLRAGRAEEPSLRTGGLALPFLPLHHSLISSLLISWPRRCCLEQAPGMCCRSCSSRGSC